MAINSVQYNRAALTTTKGASAGAIPKALQNGTVMCAFETIILDGAVHTTVPIGPALPDGAVVIGFVIAAGDLTGTLTASIGDVNTAALYASAVSVDNTVAFVAAASTTYTGGTSSEDYLLTITAGLGYRIGTTANDEQLYFDVSATGTAADTVNIVIIYSV